MNLDDEPTNKEFLIKRILVNIEAERLLPAIYAALTLSKSENNTEKTVYFQKIIGDLDFCRQLGFLDNIKSNTESAIEYYDEDKDNDPYAYNKTIEGRIIGLKKKLLSYAAQAIQDQEGKSIEQLLEAINK